MSTGRRLGAAALACASVLAVAPAAAAVTADVDGRTGDWDRAAAQLGPAGSLWEPMETLDLQRSGTLRVIGSDLAFAGTQVVGGATYVGARYRTGKRWVTVEEKWADTAWAQPPGRPLRGYVGQFSVPLGVADAQVAVPARLTAICGKARCPRSAVRNGAAVELTAVPPTTRSAPGRTTVVVRARGLSYAELVQVVRSLEQVAGSTALGAGSAQMVALCRQMVEQRLTPESAQALVSPWSYSVRVGTIDGQPQAVTADVRPDRFTVSTVGGVVTSCTYG